jgi:hypothetical protein
MRHIDTLMKKTNPEWWFNTKQKRAYRFANKELQNHGA